MSANSVRLGLQDLLFIYGETSSSKMHVAGLLPFTPPTDAPRDYLRQMIDEARHQEVMAPWNRKLAYPASAVQPGAQLGDRHGLRLRLPRPALGAGRARATSGSWASWSPGCTATTWT